VSAVIGKGLIDGGPDVQPLGIHHVAINVTDASRSVAFYTEVLGGELRDDRPDFGIPGAWIDLGAQQVHLIELPLPTEAGQHFAVLVEDLGAVVEELRARGVELDDAVRVGADLQTFVRDPDGNTVELHQVGS
jgi:glyoxylase I family protein